MRARASAEVARGCLSLVALLRVPRIRMWAWSTSWSSQGGCGRVHNENRADGRNKSARYSTPPYRHLAHVHNIHSFHEIALDATNNSRDKGDAGIVIPIENCAMRSIHRATYSSPWVLYFKIGEIIVNNPNATKIEMIV